MGEFSIFHWLVVLAVILIFFGGKRIASRDSSNNVSYYLADRLGTARIVTNSSGTVQDDSDFYPYGGERVIASASGNHYKFTGKERDSESALDNFGARYYSSQYGRFLTPDWASHPEAVPYADLENPQSLNLYSYVKNNPLSRTDPDGHCDEDGKHCFWQKLGNWIAGNGFVTNAQLRKLTEEQRQWLTDHNARKVDGKGNSTSVDWSKASNNDVRNAYSGLQEQMRQTQGMSINLPLPPGMSTADFGKDVMKWGTGDEAARTRMQSLTREELENAGVTREMAESWRDFYERVKLETPGNPSAEGRKELMQKAVELLGGK